MNIHGKPLLKIAPPYDDDLIRRIEQGFSNELGFEVEFDIIKDPALLCGFIAYVSGIVYDASGKNQLEGIKNHLIDSVISPPPAAAEEDDD